MSFRHPDDYIRHAPYDDPTIILVLVVMGQSADAEHGTLWPSVRTLARQCRLSERRLREIMNILIADGFVARQERRTASNRNTSNMYTMYLTEEAAIRKASGTTQAPQEPCDTPQGEGATHRRATPATHRRGEGATHRREKDHIENPQLKDHEEQSLAERDETASHGEAPPQRRTRERLDLTTLKRDPLISALAACLGREPLTHREWDQWRLAVNDLHSAHVCADDIPRAIKGFQTAYPRARITPFALVKHWSEIQGGTPHDLAQLEISRRAAEVEERARHERERRERERKAEQEREVKRLLVEYGYATGS